MHVRQNQATFTLPKHISAQDVKYQWSKCLSFALCQISCLYYDIKKIVTLNKVLTYRNYQTISNILTTNNYY